MTLKTFDTTEDAISNKRYAVALRIGDEQLYDKLVKLAKEQGISLNLAVIMLLGFAFNEVDRQKKKFVPKIVFETGQEPKQ